MVLYEKCTSLYDGFGREKAMNLKSDFGRIRLYTRHIDSCPHSSEPEFQACGCIKWVYLKPRKGEAQRYSLATSIWAVALAEATDTLKALDPEVAEARQEKQKAGRKMVSVGEGCKLWLDRCARDYGKEGSYAGYLSLTKKVTAWAEKRGFEFISEITRVEIEKWSGSADWIGLAKSTRKVQWTTIGSIFKYLVEIHVLDQSPVRVTKSRKKKDEGEFLQGPYAPEQVEAMFAAIDKTAGNAGEVKREVHAARLRAFMTLLLHTGCDLIDALVFNPAKLTQMKVGRRTVWVFRYNRVKTGVQAVIPIEDDNVAEMLRSVPLLPETSEAMPFRESEVELKTEVSTWSRRVARVLKAAKVEWVTLPADARGRPHRKAANAKQLRHTFAVNQLDLGRSEEQVARMLGHANTKMIQEHYAPFVKTRDVAHVTGIVETFRPKKKGVTSSFSASPSSRKAGHALSH